MRIKYLITTPAAAHSAVRTEQLPPALLGPNVEVEFAHVRNATTVLDSYYEGYIFEMYIVEAGLRTEEEGFDALIMDTASDSGLYVLRSRLTIPVLGPGLVAYCVSMMLGKRFSIVTMWDRWVHLHEKNLDTYHLWEKCASIRDIGVRPDMKNLLSGREEEITERVVAESRRAIEEDGADVIILGSTTMHQTAPFVRRELSVPVINPGPVAVKITEALLSLGLTHSKVAFPSPEVLQDEKFFSLIGADGQTRKPG
jgi:allantoin racemase